MNSEENFCKQKNFAMPTLSKPDHCKNRTVSPVPLGSVLTGFAVLVYCILQSHLNIKKKNQFSGALFLQLQIL